MNRRTFIQTAGTLALGGVVGMPICRAADRQRGWRYCGKCEGLVFDAGHCPAGERHSLDEPTAYTLTANDPQTTGQPKWRVCQRCMTLWYAGGNAKGKCPEGGEHSEKGSWDYILESNTGGQRGWFRCGKCQGLFYGGGKGSGVCPAGEKHVKVEGTEYTLEHQLYKRKVTGPAFAGWETLDAVVEKYLKRIGCTAASLTVTRSHHQVTPNGMQPTADVVPIYSRGFGWCDLEQTKPMQPDTVIDIGSCTKSFSAAAIRQMALEPKLEALGDKLDLNSSICKLLKVEPRGKVIDPRIWNVTVNHLLDMKTGWQGEPLARAFEAAGEPVMSYYDWNAHVLGFVMTQKLRDDPGQKLEYDNFAYGLIEAVIHKYSGYTHPEYLRKRLCRPFGVDDLSTDNPASHVWNAYVPGTTSPPWVQRLTGGHENINYSTPVVCRFMRYFWHGGQPCDNGDYDMVRWGSYESCTSMMVWLKGGINFAVAFNGKKDDAAKHADIEKDLRAVIEPLVAGKNKKLPPLPKPPTSLLVNGSFEQGPPTPAVGFLPLNPGSKAVNGWKVTQGQIDLCGAAFTAQDGGRSIDLHGSPGYGGIEQAFKTTVGEQYRVTFVMAGSPGGKVPIKRLAVRAAGKKEEFAFDSDKRVPNNMGWVEYAWEFEAVAEHTTLEFHTVMNADPNYGPAIDNVRVWHVPRKK